MSTETYSSSFHLDDGGHSMREALDGLLGRENLAPACSLPESTRAHRYELTLDERLATVDQALLLFRELYVNRPLKEANHGVRPVRRLELLRLELVRRKRLTERNPAYREDDHPLDFHREMTKIFMSVRDRHMRYFLPREFSHRWALLGFEIEPCYESPSTSSRPRYLVTRIFEGFDHPEFRRGVEIVSWNGVPIERAIELNADRHAGSNPAAHHARGLVRLTVRPLWVSPPPDGDWVVVGYRPSGSGSTESSDEVRYLKLDWWVATLRPEDTHSARLPGESLVEGVRVGPMDTSTGAVVEDVLVGPPRSLPLPAPNESLDDEADAVRRLRKALVIQHSAHTPVDDVPDTSSRLPDVVRAAFLPIAGQSGAANELVGYLRLYTFAVEDVDAFIEEMARQLRRFRDLGARGLILDLRDNGGGQIPAGERLLQLLSPQAIAPHRFELLVTPAATDLCRREPSLQQWVDSLEQGAEIGALYSRGLPITEPPAETGDTQVFDRPVVLIVNALSYSTTDLFTAGFRDHGLGKILATDDNIGAGGANTVSHESLLQISQGKVERLEPLPRGIGMKVALRRALRVGEQAGTPLEALGIEPDDRHYMTREDLLEKNVDLIASALQLLQTLPDFRVRARRVDHTAAAQITSSTGLSEDSRFDLRFAQSLSSVEASGEESMTLRATPAAVHVDSFDSEGRLVLTRRATLDSSIELRSDRFLELYFSVRAQAEASQRGSAENGCENAVAALRQTLRHVDASWLDHHVLKNPIPRALAQVPSGGAELVESLEALDSCFSWELHQKAIEREKRWLRTKVAPYEPLILKDELQSLGLEDPVLEIPIYLIGRAPSSGALRFDRAANLPPYGVVDLAHNPGERLAVTLAAESLLLLFESNRKPGRGSRSRNAFGRLHQLATERGLQHRGRHLLEALARVQAEWSVYRAPGFETRPQQHSGHPVEDLVRTVWINRLRSREPGFEAALVRMVAAAAEL